MIVIDTHILVWMLSAPKKIGIKARKELERAAKNDQLAISACTWLELDMLIEPRCTISRVLFAEAQNFVTLRKFAQLPVSVSTALRAGDFSRVHGDPFDLMIAATAIVHKARLMTADQTILGWQHRDLHCLDATL